GARQGGKAGSRGKRPCRRPGGAWYDSATRGLGTGANPGTDGPPLPARPAVYLIPYPRIGTMAKKTSCPITRSEFHDKAKAVKVVIDNVEQHAEVKEFSTGSLGWYLNGKTTIEIGGKRVAVQIGLNLTIVGSKELPQDSGTPAAAKPAEEVS